MRVKAVVAVLIGICLSAPIVAQIPEGVEGAFSPHPEAEEAISRLYSPFCPGFMLEVCTSSQAAALRDSMQAFAYEGQTSEQMVDWMLANYGEQYRAVPVTSGWSMWAWILPPLALAFGLSMVFVALRRFDPVRAAAANQSSVTEAGDARAISTEEEARLRSAIRDIELSEDPSF